MIKIFQRNITVSSTITPLRPLCSQLIGVSEPTRPETLTTKGKTLQAVSRRLAAGERLQRRTHTDESCSGHWQGEIKSLKTSPSFPLMNQNDENMQQEQHDDELIITKKMFR